VTGSGQIDEVEAEIKYLLPTSLVNRRFWAPGAEMNTGLYAPFPVVIHNARQREGDFSLDEHGFCISRHRSALSDFTDAEKVRTVYAAEVAQVTSALTGADFVIPMGAQLRTSGKTGDRLQPPAAEAHVDFTTASANRLARALYEKNAPDGPGYDRFIAFSLWRTFSPAPQDWPLALCDYRSVGDDEGVPNVKVDVPELPTGDALFAPIADEDQLPAATIFHHSDRHSWWYFPDMTADEVIFIKFHDSDHDRAWRAPHTAFHDSSRADAVTRESIEFRGVAYFTKQQ